MRPPPDFLQRVIQPFRDARVGMVQARWGFTNEGHSWLTRMQALLLAPHFGIEHWLRHRRGLFFNFNGTAGLWRKTAIEGAGGWRSETVTEDLELSYRAQLAGWRFVYLDDVDSELPVTLSSFRTQQQRWAQGSLQTARAMLPRVLRADLPLEVKSEAVFHLLANLGWLFAAAVSLTVYPTALSRVGEGVADVLRRDVPLFLCASGTILAYFWGYALTRGGLKEAAQVLVLPIVALGIAPSIAVGAVRGLFATGGDFVRTPKYGVASGHRLPRLAALYSPSPLRYLALHLLLFTYSLLAVWFAWSRGTWAAVPLSILFPLGFLAIAVEDLREVVRCWRARGSPAKRVANRCCSPGPQSM